MTVLKRVYRWPWLTLQMVLANVVVILSLAMAWYFVFKHQSSVYSERLMSTFNIEPGSLHAMYVDDVERQLWLSVMLGLVDLASGKVLDMGTDFDTFSVESHARRASGEVLERRMLLRDAMRRRGFKPYAREWWHFAHATEGLRSRDVPYACPG